MTEPTQRTEGARPHYLTQSRLHDPEGEPGTCLAACLAMVMRLQESDIPLRYLAGLDGPEGDWWDLLVEDCASLGWGIFFVPYPDLVEPRGWHIINGPSPRGFGHSCLGYRGELIWDPHPTRAGLVKVEDYYVLRILESSGT